MAEAIEEESKTCECGKDIRRGRDGVVPEKCFRCRLKAGEVSGRKGKPPRKPKKLRTVVDVAKKYTRTAPAAAAPANDDVVTLLEQKRKHHLDQAERIGKAIEALLEVA